jgi:thiol-disulfide isomerase/thioredoxin
MCSSFVEAVRAAIAPKSACTLAWLFLFAAAEMAFAETPPQLEADGRNGYAEYLRAPHHRAFAIAPGGAWGWKAEAASRGDAEEAALAACRDNAAQKCVLYSVDGKVVFDAKAWPRLWGPYADDAATRRAAVGREPGERFPDLAFAASDGRKLTLSQLNGKVLLLHFWGSWCGPCRREMPDLQKLHESLKRRNDIAFVLLQVREKFEVSRQWAATQALRLPFYDSTAGGEGNAYLRTASGGQIRDRDIAASFPTTYVLDKRGVVVFRHVGPVADWSEYRDFLLDAAQRSGR